MHLSAFLQFEHFTDCSIRQYRSILDELGSVFWNILWPQDSIVSGYTAKKWKGSGLIVGKEFTKKMSDEGE